MKSVSTVLTILILLVGQNAIAQQEDKLERTRVSFYDQARERPVMVDVWYKPRGNCDTLICLSDKMQTSRVVMLSHGTMGAAIDLNWLAYALASQNHLVVGLNHHGESWVYGQNTIDHKVIADASLRPTDASFALDSIDSNTDKDGKKVFDRAINTQNTLMIGHSAGGATAFILAGAQPDAQIAYQYCQQEVAKKDRSCAYMQYLPKPKKSMLMPTHLDKRFTGIIALDPAMGHAMNLPSIEQITLPTLVIGSVENDFLVHQQHGAKYAKHIPQAKLIELANGEGHFVYLSACDHSHKALGVSLCQDREGVDREKVQQQLYAPVFNMLAKL